MNDTTNINVHGNNVFFNEDNYIYVTEICKNNNTHFRYYFRNKRTQEYLKALSNELHIPILSRNGKIMDEEAKFIKVKSTFNALVCMVIGSFKDKRPQGTWIHPKLIIDFAYWLSPVFAIKMDNIMIDVLTGEKKAVENPYCFWTRDHLYD